MLSVQKQQIWRSVRIDVVVDQTSKRGLEMGLDCYLGDRGAGLRVPRLDVRAVSQHIVTDLHV